jgi:[ribosomal protein S18]-alanine N-acetyltransferase
MGRKCRNRTTSAAMIKRLVMPFTRGAPSLAEAVGRDAPAISALHGASFRRGWSEEEVETLIADRQVCTHVCTYRAVLRGPRLAGFVMSRRADDEAEILSVAVASARRGRGLARALLDLHLRRLAGFGVRAVFLEVDEQNRPALRLYARAGFREVGRRPNYYSGAGGSAASALVLRRDLN